MTADGWREAVAHGVRSTLDLRHGWETVKAGVAPHLRPSRVAELAYSLEPHGFIDAFRAASEEWKLATPVYYDEFVTNSPGRIAAAIDQVLKAPEGGVLVHCFAGRDRAGLLIAVLLDLVGADHQTIIEDHWMSFDRSEQVERTLKLKEQSGGLLPLKRDDHAEIMSDFLSTAPSSRIFGDQIDEVRAKMMTRLCY